MRLVSAIYTTQAFSQLAGSLVEHKVILMIPHPIRNIELLCFFKMSVEIDGEGLLF
jgi:hypothetical protein